MTSRPLNGPCGKALTVKTYRPCDRSSSAKLRRSPGSAASVPADAPDNRRDTPSGCSGDTACFTAGRYLATLARISGQVSPSWTRVE
jgi:hypothetical protein